MSRWCPLLLFALGCPPQHPRPSPQFCQPVERAQGAFRFSDPLLGAEVTVPVAIAFDPCDGGMLSVDATATVVGPNDEPVPSTVHLPADASGDLNQLTPTSAAAARNPAPAQIAIAEVTFTPVVPGPHHITAHFEPLGLNVQVDVESMVDKRPTVFHELYVPYECMELALSNDTALCLDQQHTVRVVVDGGVTDQIDAYSFDLAEQKVWAVVAGDAGPAVQLFDLSGAGTLTPVARLDPFTDALLTYQDPGGLTVTASGSKALIASSQGLAELSFDGGIVEGPTMLVFPSAPFAVQWVPGVGAELGVSQQQFDGFCTVRFDPAAVLNCGDDGVKFSDGRSVWLQMLTPGHNVLSATTLEADGGHSVSSSLVFSGSSRLFVQSNRLRASGPFTRDVYGVELVGLGPEAQLEYYGAPLNDDLGADAPLWEGATATRYWEWHPSGRLIYFDR